MIQPQSSDLKPQKAHLHLRVNGEDYEVLAPVHKTLLEVLREELDLTGTKHGCELGECGTCAVLVDGVPLLSCLALPIELQGREITTVEGLAEGSRPHPLQHAFAELGAAQCGYCTPGILVTAKALLERNPVPTRDDIREAISGNLCRCTGYIKIYEAIEVAAARLRDGGTGPSTSSGRAGRVLRQAQPFDSAQDADERGSSDRALTADPDRLPTAPA